MAELVLHHFDWSPYAEKVRVLLGIKGLAWRSVQIPMVMPKPDLTALTGGYRKTPVLQVGADIYCDTSLIADVLATLGIRGQVSFFGDLPAGFAYELLEHMRRSAPDVEVPSMSSRPDSGAGTRSEMAS